MYLLYSWLVKDFDAWDKLILFIAIFVFIDMDGFPLS